MSNPTRLSPRQCGLFVFQGFSVLPCPQWLQRFAGAVGQTKLHHIQYQWQNLKTQTRSFQDKEDWSIGVRTKGEVKTGGTEKTENETETERERERVPLQPTPCRCLFRHQLHTSRKGQWRREHAVRCPPRWTRPENQPVVHHVWDSHPQLGLSHIHQCTEICFSPSPMGLLFTAGNKGETIRMLGLWAATHMRFEPVSLSSLWSVEPLDQGLHGMRWALPTSACRPSRWAGRAEKSDAVAAPHLLFQMERTESEVERFQERERDKGRMMKEKGQGERGKHCPSEETEALGCWKADLALVMLKQEVEMDTCHPWEAAYGVHGGTRILSPERDNCPVSGTTTFVTDHGSCPFPVNRNWSEAGQEIQARLYCGLCYSMGKWDQLCKWGGQACYLMGWG